ncbi:Rhamnolipids biosynthesis 3-oxoacyl-[acyl-carrier-protein] reductase [Hypsizygus marmoreus]|uniref:Rhamnolipids biosynthesis 3-oxoacyl-[acyl-carrier-protein] reductase n=1 Tax=Hypsizygus marmoreus TaxID=39966 RepID=A0A369K9L6_HYPMA|nr:Rhamnolipids biosynthesis 3-oxoacyl-[acyl-carrier-protein] reductase [Hypsizygus marmoreus]
MSSFQVENLFSVKGKVALVTGGSRGIGKMISTGFVKNGVKVYITSRTAKDCEETAKELNALGPGTCIALPADLQKYEEVERLAKELASRETALHILVNNAGAAWGSTVDEFPDAAFTKVLTLNLQRVFTLTQKVLPLLRAAAASSKNGQTYDDPARIINIGSIEGLAVPDHETYAYSASKAALHHLSRHLGGRLGWEGVVSNTIACGFFESKMTAYTLATSGDPLLASTPAQRFGKPEDIAGTAMFLASPAGAYVNGATITLDGGLLLTGADLKRQALKSMSKL